MNKIKAKINFDQFSPWQDSFNNLLESVQNTKNKQKKYKAYDSLSPKTKQFKNRQKSRNNLNRTFLNISKINLNQSTHNKYQTIGHSQSKRYTGPRITFYAQMNPKINGKSRPILDPQEVEMKQKSFSSKKQMTSRMIRDQSIKYLQIIDEKPAQLTHRQSIGSFIDRKVNLKKIGLVKARISDEHHNYLRRLRMVYNNNNKK